MGLINLESQVLGFFTLAQAIQILFLLVTEIIFEIEIYEQIKEMYVMLGFFLFLYLIQLTFAYKIIKKRHIPSVVAFNIIATAIVICQTFKYEGMLTNANWRNQKEISKSVEGLVRSYTIFCYPILIFYFFITQQIHKKFQKDHYEQQRVTEENRAKYDVRELFLTFFFTWNTLNTLIWVSNWQYIQYIYSNFVFNSQGTIIGTDGHTYKYYAWLTYNIVWLIISFSSSLLCYILGVRREKKLWIIQNLVVIQLVEGLKIAEHILLYVDLKQITPWAYDINIEWMSISVLFTCFVTGMFCLILGLGLVKKLKTIQRNESTSIDEEIEMTENFSYFDSIKRAFR